VLVASVDECRDGPATAFRFRFGFGGLLLTAVSGLGADGVGRPGGEDGVWVVVVVAVVVGTTTEAGALGALGLGESWGGVRG
jgi:hypothetical protein